MHNGWTIELLGSVGGVSTDRYTPDKIRLLLSQDRTPLEHGAQFTGRPVTKLHVGEHDIVKLRPEAYRNKAASIIAVARQALEKEQSYHVHHPDKTWFVIHVEDDSSPVIGNVCPLLTPLHTILSPTSAQPIETESALDDLMSVCRLYFQTSKAHHIRLDEGLSNFGMTQDRQLYYLDDDVYPWDDCVTFAHMLGVYFRSLSWMTSETAERFGTELRRLILDVYPNGQYIYVLSGQLEDVFIPAEDRLKVFKIFKKAFERRKAERRAPEVDSRTTFAVLADIHANLPALESVLAFLDRERITQGIVLGDIVGYGPHPAECIKRLQATGFSTLKGNHDHLAAEGVVPEGTGVTSHAKWALEWTLQHLSDPDKKWLAGLPPMLEGDGWFAVHGAPVDPTFMNAYVYHMTYESNLDWLERRKLSLCFHGHTHLPAVYARKRGAPDKCYTNDDYQLNDYHHALVCPGSVGQTREGKPAARFATYEPETRTLRMHSLAYEIDRTVTDMTNFGFPNTLVERLRRGH